jgi:hypothetical protein
MQTISKRVSSKDRAKVVKYLIACQQLVLLPLKWNTALRLKSVKSEESFVRLMKHDILQIVKPLKKIGGAHHPRELPIGVALYFSDLAVARPNKFKKSLKLLTNEKACAEGLFQIASQILHS